MRPDYSHVLARFEGPRQALPHRDSVLVRCPAHPDRRPSLEVWVGPDGRLECHCYAGCTWPAIVSASGTRVMDWFPPKEEYTRRRKMSEIVAAYDYLDEGGKLSYQVVRYQPKAFSQRRPDPERPGCWINDLKGCLPLPYRLPLLLAKPDQPVFVVEGEKDVQTLERLGFVATCNSGGAGKWEFTLGKWLRNRRVCILPDNDLPGHKHACQVAGSLQWYGAASIRVCHLPGLPDGGDVTDWLADAAAGKIARDSCKRESLLVYVRSALEYRRVDLPPLLPRKAA